MPTPSLERKYGSRAHLTPQERVTLGYLIKGYTAREAAEAMCVSERTVNFHTRNILIKYKRHRITQVIWDLHEDGLISAI